MFRDLSLQIKLPVYLSIALGTGVVALSVGAYREVRRADVDAATERLGRVSDQMSRLLDANIRALRAHAVELAATPSLIDALLAGGGEAGSASARAVLDAAIAPEQAFAAELVDPDGRRVLAVGDTSRVPPGRRRSEQGGTISPLFAVDHDLVTAVSAPVFVGDEPLGTVSVWRRLNAGEAGQQVLSDLIGADVTLLVGSPDGAWTDLAREASRPRAVDLADEGGSLVSYARQDGQVVFASSAHIPDSPWYVVVEQARGAALAGTGAFLVRLGLLVPLALLVAWATAWAIGRAITRSLRETARAAEAIASGGGWHRVPVGCDDEIGRLGVSFNTMVQRVEDSQNALREVNASLATMLDGAPLPIVAHDLEGRVRIWNRASQRIFGWSSEEVLGGPSPLASLVCAPTDPGTDAGAEECSAQRRDGTAIELSVARAPTYGPSGDRDGQMLVCEDITARKEAEEQLAKYAADLARSNAELENFAYIASHDLREPLRMVRSFTELLSRRYRGRLGEDANTYIDFASEGAARMEGMIEALLEYSKVDGMGRGAAVIESGQVLARALRNLTTAIDDAGATVTHDTLPAVWADSDQLLRVFQNLVGNAIKFRGEEPPRVHVSAVDDRDRHVFSVSDNGIGIDEEYFERVFVIFQRLHGQRSYPGTGMGLAICKKIVERHGGSIWLESSQGRGTTLFFSLPRAATLVA